MSEKQEKRRRFNGRMEYTAEFSAWLRGEPPMWKFLSWRRWKKARPVMKDRG